MKFRFKHTYHKFKIPIWALFISGLIWYLFFCLPRPLFQHENSTLIYSEDFQLLGATIAQDEQWRFPVSDSVPKKFEICITQFEDAYFKYHPGVNPVSLFRAFKQNSAAGKIKSGGSTITMQTIRLAKQNPERNYTEKFLEIIQATRLELTNSKDEILNLYASYAPFGGNVVGLDAAAWRYYAKPSHQLSWAETATLAVLPNAPALIFPGKNHDLLLKKRNRLLEKLKNENYLSQEDYELAILEPLPTKPNPLPELAPHLLHTLAKKQKGKRIITSLDYHLQQQLNTIVENHHQNLSLSEIHNIAAIIVEVETGELKAYVGNTSHPENAHSNQVDVVQAPRSSGSILKPFLYAKMLQEGQLLPKMLLDDTPNEITENYDKNFSGLVPADEALAKSLNIPAIQMLENYSVTKFHHDLKDIGFTTFNKPPKHYGLSLIVGGGEVKLWELAQAYRNLAYSVIHPQETRFHTSISYTKENKSSHDKFLINPQAAYLTIDALRNVARPNTETGWQVFSTKNIAWKTGTSHGFKDAWSVGMTPNYVVAVWVGNADGEGRPGIIGVKAAAPIMFDVFNILNDSRDFQKPSKGWTEVKTCKESGYLLGANCESYIVQKVPKAGTNAKVCPYHQLVHLDNSQNYRVNSQCYPVDQIISQKQFIIPPIQEYYYIKNHPSYKKLPPFLDGCESAQASPTFDFIYPKNFSKFYLPIDFNGEKQPIVFEIAHKQTHQKLYWHLDGKFIGITQHNHKLPLLPDPGKHQLVVTDNQGNRLEKVFTVIEAKN